MRKLICGTKILSLSHAALAGQGAKPGSIHEILVSPGRQFICRAQIVERRSAKRSGSLSRRVTRLRPYRGADLETEVSRPRGVVFLSHL